MSNNLKNRKMAQRRQRTENNFWYFFLYNGEIRRTLKAEEITEELQNDPEVKIMKRTNKMGREVTEQVYDMLNGKITFIGIEDKIVSGVDYKELQIKIEHPEDGIGFLQMRLDSRFASEFLRKAVRLDLSKEVLMYPTQIKEGEQVKQFFTVKQANENGEDVAVPLFFTKDYPNGMPEIEVTTRKNGKKDYDDTDRVEFFEKMVAGYFHPKFQGKSVSIEAFIESVAPGTEITDPATTAEAAAKAAETEAKSKAKSTKKKEA
jgi:hypothetical protein